MLLGVKWDLRNKYLYVNASEEWRVQPNLADPTSTPQADELDPTSRTSTGQAQDKLRIDNVYISCLVKAIGNHVRLLYPDSPRHPRQKYLLTIKG